MRSPGRSASDGSSASASRLLKLRPVAAWRSKATQLLLGLVQLFEDRGNVPEQTKVIEEADRQVMQLLFARIRQMGN